MVPDSVAPDAAPDPDRLVNDALPVPSLLMVIVELAPKKSSPSTLTPAAPVAPVYVPGPWNWLVGTLSRKLTSFPATVVGAPSCGPIPKFHTNELFAKSVHEYDAQLLLLNEPWTVSWPVKLIWNVRLALCPPALPGVLPPPLLLPFIVGVGGVVVIALHAASAKPSAAAMAGTMTRGHTLMIRLLPRMSPERAGYAARFVLPATGSERRIIAAAKRRSPSLRGRMHRRPRGTEVAETRDSTLGAERCILQLLVALHAPVWPFALSTYDPDMLLPETVPVYATTPTAPKLMAVPDRVPVMFRLSGGDESWMLPFTADPVWFQVSVNVPLNGPLYCPVQLPPTAAAEDAAVGVAVAGAAAGALLDAVGVEVFDEEPHAATRAATLIPVVSKTMTRFIENPQVSVVRR